MEYAQAEVCYYTWINARDEEKGTGERRGIRMTGKGYEDATSDCRERLHTTTIGENEHE